jgi:hypothetical protein
LAGTLAKTVATHLGSLNQSGLVLRVHQTPYTSGIFLYPR